MKTPAKIAFIDIETAPSLGWVWQKYETDVIEYKLDIENDRALVEDLWKVFDEADILIAHNGDSFDIPKVNTRFLTHKLPPPSLYKTVDTLKIARKVFKFDSNKLDDLGRYLGIGRKLPTTGFHLWRGCMLGDAKSWAQMKRYNAHDTELLEDVYYRIRAWHPTHPNVNNGELEVCPTCSSKNVQRRGFSFTLHRRKQRYQCLNCQHWYTGSAKKVD